MDIGKSPRKKIQKTLQDGSVKTYNVRRKPRKNIDFIFDTDSQKLAFEEKLKDVKQNSNIQSNADLFVSLLDLYQAQVDKGAFSEADSQSENIEFQENGAFICTRQKLEELLTITGSWKLVEYRKDGHVCEISIVDTISHVMKEWQSSDKIGKYYELNYKLVHSFLCAGVIEAQYVKLCDFAAMGVVSETLRKKTYQLLSVVAEEEKNISLSRALAEEKACAADESISIMSDARHACRKNSYHSDIVAIGQKTHKVVSYQHITKETDHCSQRHEIAGTRLIYEEMDRLQINVKAHVHDRNASISKFIVENRPNTYDACDTWHAAKEVKKETSKIVKGARKNIGVTWHPQLADKASGIKTHSFWAIKNCGGDEVELRRILDNTVEHYCGNHLGCHQTSRCRQHGYIPSREIVTDPDAQRLLRQCIQKLIVYKKPEKYKYCMDTHYVESFNNVVLIYVDKRVHLKNLMYKLKLCLAILDWNDHVDRPTSSVRDYKSAQNPRRMAPHRVLKPKTFEFVYILWQRLRQAALNAGNQEDDDENGDDEDGDDDDDTSDNEDDSFVC